MNEQVERVLLAGLNEEQQNAVRSQSRLLGVVAGAGSGKTEVMSRRVAWWVGVDEVERSKIVAFTFTEAAAEELKFRVREKIQSVFEPVEEATLSGMYGTRVPRRMRGLEISSKLPTFNSVAASFVRAGRSSAAPPCTSIGLMRPG